MTMLGITAASAVDVTIWCWDTNFNGAAMREAAARYNATHPDVNIIIDDSDTQDNIRQKLQTQLLAGNTEGLPDIVLIQDDTAQKYLLSFPGAFEPLGDSIDMTPVRATTRSRPRRSTASPTRCPSTPASPASSTAPTISPKPGFTAADLQNLTWDQLIEIGKAVKEKTGHELFGIDYNEVGWIRMMLQLGRPVVLQRRRHAEPRRQRRPSRRRSRSTRRSGPTGSSSRSSGWTDFTGSFTSGDVAGVPIGVWIVGTIKANAAADAGKWAVAPVPRLDVEGAANASNWGGSSWYVLASSPAEKGRGDRLPQDRLGRRRRLLPEDPRRPGRRRHVAPGPRRRSLPVERRRSSAVSPSGRTSPTWLAKVPDVDYGIFTAEVDSAISAQLPTIAQGGDIDAAIKAINAQATQATQ